MAASSSNSLGHKAGFCCTLMNYRIMLSMYMTCSMQPCTAPADIQQVVTQSYVLSIWEEPGPELSTRRAGDGGGNPRPLSSIFPG